MDKKILKLQGPLVETEILHHFTFIKYLTLNVYDKSFFTYLKFNFIVTLQHVFIIFNLRKNA